MFFLNSESRVRAGDKSNFRSVEFVEPEPSFEPWYRLEAKTNPETLKPSLFIYKQNRGLGDKEYKPIKELKPDSFGRWDHPYHIETFNYEERKYKVVFLSIKAAIDEDKIVVSYAKLTYPQYILVIE